MSKGSHRRREDAGAVRRNWPFPEKACCVVCGKRRWGAIDPRRMAFVCAGCAKAEGLGVVTRVNP